MGRLASGLALFLILAALASRADALVDCGSQTWCPSNPDAKCDCEFAPKVITTCAFGQRCAEQGSGFYNCVAFTCSTPVDPVVSAANCDSGGAAWTPPSSDPGATCECPKFPGSSTSSECKAGESCLGGACSWPRCPTSAGGGGEAGGGGAGQTVWVKRWCSSKEIHLLEEFYTNSQCTGSKFPLPPRPSGQGPVPYQLDECLSVEALGGPAQEGGPAYIIFSCTATATHWNAKFYTDSRCSNEYEKPAQMGGGPFVLPEEETELGCIEDGDTSQFDVVPACPGMDGKTAFNGLSGEKCQCDYDKCASGEACRVRTREGASIPSCDFIFVGKRDDDKCALYPDQKCSCGFGGSEICKIGQSCITTETGNSCVTATVLPASATCKVPPRTVDFKLTHTIIIVGVAPGAFNSNKNMIAAFKAAVVRTLGIDPRKIPIGGIQAGPRPAAAAGPAPAAAPAPSSANNDGGGALRRRLEDSCAVSYDVLAKDKAELELLKSIVESKMSCASCGNTFATNLKASMGTEGVEGIDRSSIVVDTTSKPKDTTCTSASNSVVVTCNAGSWKNGTACDTCSAVSNAATVTCTNASNSVVATCMSGYTADSSGVCKKDATPEPAVPAAPSPSDDHHGHDHDVVRTPSAADVSSATTMSPASMLTALAMLVAYVMH